MIAIVLVAIVVASGLGYWLLAPKLPSQITFYTTAQTPSISSSIAIAQTSTASSTVTSSTTLAETVQWINVSGATVRPVSYYLKLLESNGTEPYAQLAEELRKLPDLSNATAVAKITYLALNATNPEVKEAFELMIKGGTPDSHDFTYVVPNYDTELQVLYWLACQNEFKKDDTLALAIAIDHGIWVTMGDSEVASLARQDASGLLVFLRQTSQMQSQRGYFDLEKYPLEAKITLAWRGDQSSVRSYYDPRDYLNKKMDPKAYRWATIELSTLTQMRELMDTKAWIQSDIARTVATLETYFFTGPNRMWIYPSADETITINGQSVINHNFNSADLEFSYFVQNGKGIGWCSDEMGLLNAFLKSWGIATSALWGDLIMGGKKDHGHTHVIYYDPLNQVWKADPSQLGIDVQNKFNLFYISTPKVSLTGFLESNRGSGLNYVFSKFILDQTDVNAVSSMFLSGVPSSEMKQWLLYS